MITDHLARTSPVSRDESQAARHALRTEKRPQLLVRAQSVLQGENGGLRSEQRRQEAWKFAVGRGLERHDDEINRTNFIRRPENRGRAQFSCPLTDAQPDRAAGANRCKIAPHQKAHIPTGKGELRAVIKADRAGANDGDFLERRGHEKKRGGRGGIFNPCSMQSSLRKRHRRAWRGRRRVERELGRSESGRFRREHERTWLRRGLNDDLSETVENMPPVRLIGLMAGWIAVAHAKNAAIGT